jgi:hypothetical protein
MVKNNHLRSGCIDVFKSYLVKDAIFAGDLEIPTLKPASNLPTEMKPFSQAISSKERHIWVHFFEDDVKFERIWNNPKRYIKILSEFDGVISPDFSLYRDMPLVMQYWNIYRSRAIAHALQSIGTSVIPNIRFGDQRTWKACCLGIPTNSIIAVGSHGNIKNTEDRKSFSEGLDYVVKTIRPNTIIVYGAAPKSIFDTYSNRGIRIIVFASEFSLTHRGVD